MKKFKKTLIYLLIIEIIIPTIVIAHSGRTDSSGGHHVTATGEYHYHHGYPAHQHINGVCPYNKKDSKEDSTTADNILYTIIGLFFILPLLSPLLTLIIDSINNKFFSKKKNNDIITQQINKASKSHTTKGNYICPRCGGKTIIKYGKYGAFIGCSNYPYCKYTKNLRKY